MFKICVFTYLVVTTRIQVLRKKKDQAIINCWPSGIERDLFRRTIGQDGTPFLEWTLSLFLSLAEPYHTLLHLYQSTRPNTASSCLGWCRLKLSCAVATWSWCKLSFKLPARSKKHARRPLLTCAGTAPPLTSLWMLESIAQTSKEVCHLIFFWFVLHFRNICGLTEGPS